ncbi:MAG: hypothetical protein AAFY72_09750 [Cyanobacteria bacterium J06649_4]
MSDAATFEFQTDTELESLRQASSKYWVGKGRQVDIYSWENPHRTFCVLEHFGGGDEEKKMLCQVAEYLLTVARNNCVYYYRCMDFVSDFDPNNYENKKLPDFCKSMSIEVKALLLEPYQPSMSANITERFILKLEQKPKSTLISTF